MSKKFPLSVFALTTLQFFAIGCKDQDKDKTVDLRSDEEIIQAETNTAGLDAHEESQLALHAERCRKETGRPPLFARVVSRSQSEVRGFLMIRKDRDEKVRIQGFLRGLKPDADHGFHIHETGSCASSDAVSAGGHYNPDKKSHGAPNAESRHAGDLGNIKANAQGRAWVDVMVDGVKFEAMSQKSLIVHRDPDDFKTQPTGNAGPRIGCAALDAVNGTLTPIAPTEYVINLQSQAAPQPQIKGRLVVKEVADGIEVTGNVEGLNKNAEHAVHFHENPTKAQCMGDFTNVGGHFNPSTKPHGDPTTPESHLGDLGNIKTDGDGKAAIKITRKGAKILDPTLGVLGRALVIHANPDDFKTQSPPGNAGARIGCGLVQ